MNDNNKHSVNNDIRCLIGVSVSLIVVLFGVMIFSPLSYQFYDEGFSRGSSWEMTINELIETKQTVQALNMLDSLIEVKEHTLPHFPYLDRFLPENEQMDVANARSDIYELQWKRIEILNDLDDKDALIVALRQYSKVMGYNQDEAETMFEKLKKN